MNENEKIQTNNTSSGSIVLFALGNEFRGDDGAGLAVLRRLKERGNLDKSRIFLVEAGRRLMANIGIIEERAPATIIFIDSAELHKEPGSWMCIEKEDISGRGITEHESGFQLALAYINKVCPLADVKFIGIQFANVEMTEQLQLSASVEMAVGDVVAELARLFTAT